MLDPAHIIKLIRNAFGEKKIFLDYKDRIINFQYLQKLCCLQEEEGCYLANKLRKQHIFYFKQKMKVKLATQLLSQSVADALKFFKDFEKTAHNAVLQIFPNCKIACCNFHLGQNWFRHIQQHKILSSEYLNNDSEIGKWIKYFFGLSYLPPEEFSDGFCDLMSMAPSNKFSTTSIFSDYILENCITSDSNFP